MNNIVALDLELNQLNNAPKIIQIGLTIADLDTRTILDKKSIMVHPQEGITEYIATLTGITDNQVKDAPDLAGAYKEMIAYLKPFEIHKQPILWGNGDIWAIKRELATYPEGVIDWKTWPFGFTEMNIKTVVQMILTSRGQKTQGGLAKSMNKFGLRFLGTKHRADDDSYNTMILYMKLLDILKNV